MDRRIYGRNQVLYFKKQHDYIDKRNRLPKIISSVANVATRRRR